MDLLIVAEEKQSQDQVTDMYMIGTMILEAYRILFYSEKLFIDAFEDWEDDYEKWPDYIKHLKSKLANGGGEYRYNELFKNNEHPLPGTPSC